VPPLVDGNLAGICQPHHHVRCARTDFVIATGASIRFGRSRGGDGSHFVIVAVGPGFHPTLHRQRP